MEHRTLFAPARPVACAFVLALATTMLVAPVGARPDAGSQSSRCAQSQGSAGCAAATEGSLLRPPREQQQAAEPQLIFSPWTKFCLKGQEAGAKQVCFTGKDGRVESGMPVVAAVLIEPEGEPRKFCASRCRSACRSSLAHA